MIKTKFQIFLIKKKLIYSKLLKKIDNFFKNITYTFINLLPILYTKAFEILGGYESMTPPPYKVAPPLNKSGPEFLFNSVWRFAPMVNVLEPGIYIYILVSTRTTHVIVN